jgi:hypothetical protein
MWRDAVGALARASIESLEVSRAPGVPTAELGADLQRFVCERIEGLPWFYRAAAVALGTGLALVRLATAGRGFEEMNARERDRFVARSRRLPGIHTLERLARSLALLRAFDCPELADAVVRPRGG